MLFIRIQSNNLVGISKEYLATILSRIFIINQCYHFIKLISVNYNAMHILEKNPVKNAIVSSIICVNL
jgi:hypothetical protein